MVPAISEHSACQSCQSSDNQWYNEMAPKSECKEILHFCKAVIFGIVFVTRRF